jgi:hypothetical protein
MSMRPIPESDRADALYGPFMWRDVDLFERLQDVSGPVRELVPPCVGLSMSLREHGVTLTLVASEERIATMDAVQYVDGGPCVDALRDGVVIDAHDRPTLRHRWGLFADVTERNGIEATLSLPVPWEGEGVLGFNLYASTTDAFDGHHEELAELLGAWADGAVVDADLAFASRRVARQAPDLLRESTDLAVVSMLLARERGFGVEEAERRLREAAVRAAIPLTELLDIMRHVLPDAGGAEGGHGDEGA